MMLWAVIVLAQVRGKCGQTRIPIPSGPQGMGRYLETQGNVIREFMATVHAAGVKDNIFQQASTPSRSWFLSEENATTNSIFWRTFASWTNFLFGRAARFIANDDLVQQ